MAAGAAGPGAGFGHHGSQRFDVTHLAGQPDVTGRDIQAMTNHSVVAQLRENRKLVRRRSFCGCEGGHDVDGERPEAAWS